METSSKSLHASLDSDSDSKPHPSMNLVAWSFWLAILLDFSPIGSDPLISAYHAKSIPIVVALASTYTALILAPLALIVRRNGFRGYWVAPIRITIILLIVTFHSVSDVHMIRELTR